MKLFNKFGRASSDETNMDRELEMLNSCECLECGTIMNLVGDVLVCPNCGHSVDQDDYITECEEALDYGEYYPSASDEILDIPEGCRACGWPYPSCTSSCNLFED